MRQLGLIGMRMVSPPVSKPVPEQRHDDDMNEEPFELHTATRVTLAPKRRIMFYEATGRRTRRLSHRQFFCFISLYLHLRANYVACDGPKTGRV